MKPVSTSLRHAVLGSKHKMFGHTFELLHMAQHAAPSKNQIHLDALRGKSKRIVAEKWFLSLEPKQIW